MFKRRDWVHMHGQDGEGSSDDDSSGDSELAKNSSSSSADTDGDTDSSQVQTSADSDAAAVESDGAEEADPLSSTKRLQDLSEDDYEEPAEPRIDVDELVQNWLTAPAAEHNKGPPLRCKWCPGTLLLNATALKNHLESKRHVKRQKVSKDEPSPICLAEDVLDDESEGETHAERLERLRQLSAPPQLSNVSDSKRRRLIRKLKAEQRSKAAKQRPGKRQRAELKAQIFQDADGSAASKAAKPGAKKQKQKQDARGKQNNQGKKESPHSSKKRQKS